MKSEKVKSGPKYKLGEKHPDRELYRIVALSNFYDVEAGDIGGWVESECNLSQFDGCWIFDDAIVSGKAFVSDHARVEDNAEVYDYAEVCGKGMVYDDAEVYDSAKIYDDAEISGNASVFGYARVYDRVINQELSDIRNEPCCCSDEVSVPVISDFQI